MQVTRPNEIQRPGVTLHPKACAPLRLRAERATPRHPETKYQERVAGMPWVPDMPESPLNPYSSPQRRGRAQARQHILPA